MLPCRDILVDKDLNGLIDVVVGSMIILGYFLLVVDLILGLCVVVGTVVISVGWVLASGLSSDVLLSISKSSGTDLGYILGVANHV